MIMSPPQIIVAILNPLHARVDGPPVDLPLDALRQDNFQIAPVPPRKQHRHEHHARLVRLVGHPRVPEPKVADDQGPLGQGGLDRWPYLPSSLEQVFPDPSRGRVKDAAVGLDMRPGPDFRGAVLRRSVDQVDIDTIPERHAGEVEIDVDVHRLAVLGEKGCVGAVEPQRWIGAKHAFHDGDGERVGDDIVEDVVCFQHRFLLDVARVRAEVAVRFLLRVQDLGFGHHSRVQLVQMRRVDGVLQHADSISMESLDGRLEVVRANLFSGEFVGSESDDCDVGGCSHLALKISCQSVS